MKEDQEKDIKKPNKDFIKIEILQKNFNVKKRKVKSWTNEEDDKLLSLFNQHPKKWGLISSKMQDRNQNQCLHRYRRLSQIGVCKKIWTTKEDQAILSLIKKLGKNWKVIAEILGTKTGKQIRERFINKLDPQIKNDEWTQQEDQLIVKYYSQYGSKWSQISKKIPGRPENKIKNRFYSFIQKHYEIKYIHLSEQNQNIQEQSKGKQLKQITLNSKQTKQKNQNKKQLVSIKQIEQQLAGFPERDDIFDSNALIVQRYGLHSLIKVDEEPLCGNQNRYNKSGRNLVSNNEIENENDLFYLSQH